MIPVHILTEGSKLPKQGTYYVVAKGGIFLHKDNGLIEATVKVDTIPFLKEVAPSARLRLPKLPPQLMVQALLFFRRVYRLYASEAMVLLHYSSDQCRYVLHCPQQQVGPASINYNSGERFDGFQLVGTIHSHASMSAFHSGIDDADEQHFDGLHITIGCLDQPYFKVSCSIVVNGQRFPMPPSKAIIGIREVKWRPASQLSYRRNKVPVIALANFFDFDWLELDSTYKTVAAPSRDQFYDMALPDGQDYRYVGVPKVWLDQVTKSGGIGGQAAATCWRGPLSQERK